MPDPSPDTPSVCPECGSDEPDAFRMTPDGAWPCTIEGPHDSFHAPALRSSSPDTAALVAELRAESEYVRLRSAGNGETVTMLVRAADALEAQAARITELEAEREALRRFALQQHIAIGALRRIHGGNRLFDDTGAERLWMFGESDKGWALIEEPTTPTEETTE